jgi:hypothetical protein
VVVEETEDLPLWETIRPLEQQLRELEERFQWEEPSKALDEIRQAISRHLIKRAADLENDPALVAQGAPNGSAQDPAGAEAPEDQSE